MSEIHVNRSNVCGYCELPGHAAADCPDRRRVPVSSELDKARAALKHFGLLPGFVGALERFEAAVRAIEALTTQIRRALTVGAQQDGYALAPPVVDTDDAPTTPDGPAEQCQARWHPSGPTNQLPTACIRPARHVEDHADGSGFHWTDAVAIYPTAEPGAVEFRPPPGPPCIPDHSVPVPCPGCDVEEPDPAADATCRRMETRTCPPTYNGPCGNRPCARFESDDPAPWLDPAETPYVGATTMPKAAPDDGSSSPSWERRKSLAVLLSRAQRGVTPLTSEESDLLRRHVETEIREADTARAVAAGNKRHVQTIVPEIDRLTAELEDAEQRADGFLTERDQAQAAIERVRAAVKWARHNHPGLVHVHDRLRAALDGTEQPTTEA